MKPEIQKELELLQVSVLPESMQELPFTVPEHYFEQAKQQAFLAGRLAESMQVPSHYFLHKKKKLQSIRKTNMNQSKWWIGIAASIVIAVSVIVMNKPSEEFALHYAEFATFNELEQAFLTNQTEDYFIESFYNQEEESIDTLLEGALF